MHSAHTHGPGCAQAARALRPGHAHSAVSWRTGRRVLARRAPYRGAWALRCRSPPAVSQVVCHHHISSPCEYRKMMCPKPLEVTRTSLATCCTSLCNSSSSNPYSLSKGLLVKYWWYLASTSWTTPMSSPSTSQLHMSNGKLSFNAISLRCNYNPETLFTYRKIFHTQCPCIHK